ncbi:MAG: hypothetical protein HYX90_07200 [Chloroflexi bacterium]|nr:hypothetical protein [Chloroflexota bacterium]
MDKKSAAIIAAVTAFLQEEAGPVHVAPAPRAGTSRWALVGRLRLMRGGNRRSGCQK